LISILVAGSRLAVRGEALLQELPVDLSRQANQRVFHVYDLIQHRPEQVLLPLVARLRHRFSPGKIARLETPYPWAIRWLASLHARIEGWSGCADRSLKHGRRAMDQDTTYVAFDTSKETIAVAIAESGRRKEVRFFGTIASRPDAVRKLVEKLAR